jgi:hypothetical protein
LPRCRSPLLGQQDEELQRPQLTNKTDENHEKNNHLKSPAIVLQLYVQHMKELLFKKIY